MKQKEWQKVLKKGKLTEEYSDIHAGITTKKDLIKDLPKELIKYIDPGEKLQPYHLKHIIKQTLKRWAIDVTKKELIDIYKELFKTYDKWK